VSKRGRRGEGRPRKYPDHVDFDRKVRAYFRDCEKKQKPYTLTELAYVLGMDRHEVCNYGKRDEYSATIKWARAKVTAQAEARLFGQNGHAGAIFWLKNNAGWRDDSRIEVGLTLTDILGRAASLIAAGTDRVNNDNDGNDGR